MECIISIDLLWIGQACSCGVFSRLYRARVCLEKENIIPSSCWHILTLVKFHFCIFLLSMLIAFYHANLSILQCCKLNQKFQSGFSWNEVIFLISSVQSQNACMKVSFQFYRMSPKVHALKFCVPGSSS